MARALNNSEKWGGGSTFLLSIAGIILLIMVYSNPVYLDGNSLSRTLLQILGFIFLVPFLIYVIFILCLFCPACCVAALGPETVIYEANGCDPQPQPQPQEV